MRKKTVERMLKLIKEFYAKNMPTYELHWAIAVLELEIDRNSDNWARFNKAEKFRMKGTIFKQDGNSL